MWAIWVIYEININYAELLQHHFHCLVTVADEFFSNTYLLMCRSLRRCVYRCRASLSNDSDASHTPPTTVSRPGTCWNCMWQDCKLAFLLPSKSNSGSIKYTSIWDRVGHGPQFIRPIYCFSSTELLDFTRYPHQWPKAFREVLLSNAA